MAAKNSVKNYVENGIYHIYNRGVNKQDVFRDDFDFSVFLSYLKTYLIPKDEIALRTVLASSESSYKEKYKAEKELALKNFSAEINLLAYTLLPNHFHLLISQSEARAIDQFMNALGVRYAGFFNRKYKRVGPVFQGVYKAVLVQSDEQLLHLSRYIHLNAFVRLDIPIDEWQKNPYPSSLPEFYRPRHSHWLKPDLILNQFNQNSQSDNYANFMGSSIDSELIAIQAIDLDNE